MSTIFIDFLEGLGTIKHYQQAEIIDLDDLPPDHVFLVMDGIVKHTFYGATGEETVYMILKKGAIFGEITYFRQDKNMVLTQAMSNCTIAEINSSEFEQVLAAHPELYKHIAELMAWKMRVVMSQIKDLAFGSAGQRVARRLLHLAKYHGTSQEDGSVLIDLDLTHQELANMASAYRSTVSRVLNAMRKHGLVETKRKQITVLDLDGLKNWQE
ncbi:MAG: Crp/Fnr family transcriptional regulator [Firmicutes bacterium]|nr:Crp/Fnr family transcriptional regulator [Bacillota bacterium]